MGLGEGEGKDPGKERLTSLEGINVQRTGIGETKLIEIPVLVDGKPVTLRLDTPEKIAAFLKSLETQDGEWD